MAALLALGACGVEGPRFAVPGTVEEAGRPLSDGRQGADTFLTPEPEGGDLFDVEPSRGRQPDPTTPTTAVANGGPDPTTTDPGSTPTDPASADPPIVESSEPGASSDESPWPAVNKAFDRFTNGATAPTAMSLTIVSDGDTIVNRATGVSEDGSELEPDSPMLVAGVSKLVTTLAISRLADDGLVDLDAPVPWEPMGFTTNRKWADVTVRELVEQTSGMPPANAMWAAFADDCRTKLATTIERPPQKKRQGVRFDSNGNACALGLLIEHVSGESLDVAVQRLVFDPAGVEGFHTVGDGLLPGDGGMVEDGLTSLTGGAGAFVVSTEDLAAVFSTLSATDREIFSESAVMTDQYGWGHTGIAKRVSACLWMLDDGNTVVAGAIAGGNAKGAMVCDRIVPAISDDLELGLGTGKPQRTK